MFLLLSSYPLVSVEPATKSKDKNAAKTTTVASNSTSKSEDGPYRLQPGDTVDIVVSGENELSGKRKINTDGTITLPHVGPIKIGGLTVAEAERKVTEAFKTILKNPMVALTAVSSPSRLLYLQGQVKSPNKYEIPMEETWTLVRLIAEAGGFAENPAKKKISVKRKVAGKTEQIRVNYDKEGDTFIVKPGDVVEVPESFW